jgi:carboxymethylenebutenolidase
MRVFSMTNRPIITLIAGILTALLLAACGSPASLTPESPPAASAPTTAPAEAAPNTAPTTLPEPATEPTAAPDAPAGTAAPAATQSLNGSMKGESGPVTIEITDGSVARYIVNEQLAERDLPSDAVGETSNMSGSITFNADGTVQPENSVITVNLQTLQSDEDRRDNFIKENTLQTNTFPTTEFVVKEISGLPWPLPESGEASFQMSGDMTVRDVTHPVTWDTVAQFSPDSVTAQATSDITFEQFGMDKPSLFFILSVDDNIRMELDVAADINGEAAAATNMTNSDMLTQAPADSITEMELDYFEDAKGFFARPDDSNSYPGVVMIHEWWGLNDHIKDMARQLAQEGYAVLAVDLYSGQVADTPQEARELVSSLDQEKALQNMMAAIEYLRANGSEQIASLGWCFGGGQSMQLALAADALDATVIYYGNLVTDEAQLASIQWPVLGIFGDQDESIPVETVNEFDAALDSLGIPNEIYIYEGVGHAFANPSGDNYAPEETMDAWAKTVAFLDTHLKSG